MMKITKAIIPAAGLGTRFLPATKAMPKEMLPILDKPTIQYIVEEAAKAGIEDIIIVTGKHKRAIEDHARELWEDGITREGSILDEPREHLLCPPKRTKRSRSRHFDGKTIHRERTVRSLTRGRYRRVG